MIYFNITNILLLLFLFSNEDKFMLKSNLMLNFNQDLVYLFLFGILIITIYFHDKIWSKYMTLLIFSSSIAFFTKVVIFINSVADTAELGRSFFLTRIWAKADFIDFIKKEEETNPGLKLINKKFTPEEVEMLLENTTTMAELQDKILKLVFKQPKLTKDIDLEYLDWYSSIQPYFTLSNFFTVVQFGLTIYAMYNIFGINNWIEGTKTTFSRIEDINKTSNDRFDLLTANNTDINQQLGTINDALMSTTKLLADQTKTNYVTDGVLEILTNQMNLIVGDPAIDVSTTNTIKEILPTTGGHQLGGNPAINRLCDQQN